MNLVKLPSRYEDLDTEFRGSLKPSKPLIEKTKQAFQSAAITGGIRFLPIFGRSGSGKTSAALEIGTHLPEVTVLRLNENDLQSKTALLQSIETHQAVHRGKKVVCVVDEYEERVSEKENIPSQFVEILSLLDRGELRANPTLFYWLTTNKDFQKGLVNAANRNERILVDNNFEIIGPPRKDWPAIIKENFEFHNSARLEDYQILDDDLYLISSMSPTVGHAIEKVGQGLSSHVDVLHDMSEYQVIMLWPVTDGQRISKVQQFTDPRDGYKINWGAWTKNLNTDDLQTLPLKEMNKARLYFDMRLVPIAAADLHKLCLDLDKDDHPLHKSYLERFRNTHFFLVISDNWRPEVYAPLRERQSNRAEEAKKWYEGVTRQPTALGKRIAKCITALGLKAGHESDVRSPYRTVRADVFVESPRSTRSKKIIEIKAFGPENTMPSTIAQQIRTTMRRHAELLGLMKKS